MKAHSQPSAAKVSVTAHGNRAGALPLHDESDDRAAWIRAAMAQYESPLTLYSARLLRGDVERARDVVQDAFLKLWTADRSDVQGHLGQWLYRVARNRALDIRRKESRMTALQDEQLEIIGRRPVAAGDARDDSAPPDAAREPHTPVVIALLGTLNETQQEALRLKFQGGLSYKEIAAVMDITSNHVGVLIHNAIKALRERLAGPAGGAPESHSAATSGAQARPVQA